ncbi:MAG: RNA methyltransferase [Lachnospiraceae bacterium]|nr:RNA methyltransferase [Lachnospiraceae bacterium]
MSELIELHEFHDPRLDVFARLNENQLRHFFEPNGGLFIAESPKVAERALRSGCMPVSALVDRKQAEGEAADVIMRLGRIPIFTGESDQIRKLTNIPMTRGLLVCFMRPKLHSVEGICCGKRRVAVLENVTNPTNVGAIFRSAAALGVEAVLLNSACSDPLYRRASRVSMGTVFQVPWTYLVGGASYVDVLHDLGFRTAAMALTDRSVGIDDPGICAEGRLAIILGAEGDGLSPETIAACDYTVRIPMSNGVDSLNVAAAAAVAFWQLRAR